ncbi:MAG TPA: hypothetical protein VEV39_06430 [Gemmatimonadales bacterium]|nr:hypothetical protein [Gemmatimonadales bacterium]
MRGQIVTPGSVGHGERELALLMRQGMAAWIGAWQRRCETPDDASPGFPAVSVEGTAPPAGLRGEIVMLLTGMVLSVSRREERPGP